MTSGDIAAWAGLILSVLAGVAAVFVYFGSERRERHRALGDLHNSLTSGETAAARNTIGTLLYDGSRTRNVDRLEAISAYFALIWALQRARNVFRTYRFPWRTLEHAGVLGTHGARDVTAALTWNLSEIAENIVLFHDRYRDQWAVEDDDAWAEISEYVNAKDIRRRHDEREEPPVTEAQQFS
ncbi:hypothetical protein PQI51_11045 [Microbacterium esteraromaticum]|uniref:hypothetical protein n=1 Tax=Microbacterium esteraromaticum TaxID=57043 RepID=UPI0030AFC040